MVINKHKALASNLRRDGLTYGEIATLLDLPKSSVYSWTKDLELTNDQKNKILEMQYQARIKQVGRLAKVRKLETQKKDQIIAKSATIINKDIEFTVNQKKLLCALLLWCEGEKGKDYSVRFINSDPALVTTFLKLFRESFEIDERKFRALIHLHDYHDHQIQTRFWSKQTNIPVTQF